MMNKFYLLLLLISYSLQAQIPNGYYDAVTGSGYALKTQLKNIITNGHVDQGYSALYTEYANSDLDTYYENDGSILDIYSENPTGSDPYNYTFSSDECGNYNGEGVCYNREHIFPQGFFNSQSPMRSDIHHVPPTDGRVNNFRNNFMFGDVGTNLVSQNGISNPTMNGSKLGNCITTGYTGTVFEPIDEFKGDVARMLLYFAVRYEDNWNDSGWDSPSVTNNPLNGTSDQFYETWYINLLVTWHTNDPVSQKEVERNNAAYTFQGNRNPFIDHPEWASNIWSSVLSINDAYASQLNIYPNPTQSGVIYINRGNTAIQKVTLYAISGKELFAQEINNNNHTLKFVTPYKLPKGLYFLKIQSKTASAIKKIVVN